MANYIVSNATFTPYTYEELIKPYENYLKEYAETEAGLASLAEQAAAAGGFTDVYLGEAAQTAYNKYNEALNTLANDFYQQGYSSAVKRRAIQSKADYKSQIEPIINADTAIKKLIEEQRKGNPKGDIQYTKDASNLTISDYLKNPTFTYEGRSLSEMEKAGTDIATAASSRKIITEKAKNMANQYYKVITGYNKEDVEKFIQQNKNSSEYKELMDLYKEIKDAYGTENLESPYSPDQNELANERILLGMLKGLVNKVDYSTNHWGLPGAKATSRSSSGVGNAENDIVKLGYQIIVKDKDGNPVIYTKYDDAIGGLEYLDSDNRKYTYNKTENGKKIYSTEPDENGIVYEFSPNDADPKLPELRYYAEKKGNLYLIHDAWELDNFGNPMPVVQDGNNMIYNPEKYDYNVESGRLVEKPKKPTEKTAYTHIINRPFIFTKGAGNYYHQGAGTQIPTLTESTSFSDVKDYIRLTESAASALTEEDQKIKYAIVQKLPDEIKNAINLHVIQYNPNAVKFDKNGNIKMNTLHFIVYPKQPVRTPAANAQEAAPVLDPNTVTLQEPE